MKRLTLALFLAIAAGCPSNELLHRTPVKTEADLRAVARAHEEELATHILPEGLVVYAKRPPGDLAAPYRQGVVQADGAFHNGIVLAARSFKFAVTRDPDDRRKALACWLGRTLGEYNEDHA